MGISTVVMSKDPEKLEKIEPLSELDRTMQSETIKTKEQNEVHCHAIASNPDQFPSVANLRIPNTDQIEPFQIVDGEEQVAASRIMELAGNPSFHEGLKALPEGATDDQKAQLQISYIERKAEEIQVVQAEKILLASNTAPVAFNFEQRQKFDDVQSDSIIPAPEAIIAGENSKVLQSYRDARKSAIGMELIRVTKKPDFSHPYAGHETALLQHIPKSAWSDAFVLLPELAESGLTANQVKILSKAILANEMRHYDSFDQMDDISVKNLGVPLQVPGRNHEDATLGYLQMSVNAVKMLSEEFPSIGVYLRKHGYSNGSEMKVLIDPAVAPILIAGNFAHNIRMYRNHGILINERTLSYGFNPDISFRAEDLNHEHPLTPKETRNLTRQGIKTEKVLLPTEAVLVKSQHVKNIQDWLELFIKTGGK